MKNHKAEFIASLKHGDPINVMMWDNTLKPAVYIEFVSWHHSLIMLAGHRQVVETSAIREVEK
jgi:hypothetical protein